MTAEYSIGTDLLAACAAACRRTADLATVELVAARTAGIPTERSTPLLRSALEDGDLPDPPAVGDYIELPAEGPSDVGGRLDSLFAVATDHDVGVEVEICPRDAAGFDAYRQLFDRIEDHGYEGRVTAVHNYSLAHLGERRLRELLERFRELDVRLLVHCGSADPGFSVRELLDTGVTLAHCTDNDRDFVTPHGLADQLDAARLLSYKLSSDRRTCPDRGYAATSEMLGRFADMITTGAAQAAGLGDHGIVEGAPADLVVLGEPSVQWAIVTQADRRCVISDGSVVAKGEEIVM